MRRLTKIAILAAIVILSSFELSAQSKVKVIPKVGINISRFDANWTDFEDYKNSARVGWQAGVDVRLGRFLYIMPGLHYTSTTLQNISRTELDNNTFTFGEEMTLQSIKLPLNVGLKFLGLRVQGGVIGNYVLNIKDPNGNTFDLVLLNKMTAATNMGVGLDILFLSIDFNYEKGISDYFNNVAIKNNTYSLTVGVKF